MKFGSAIRHYEKENAPYSTGEITLTNCTIQDCYSENAGTALVLRNEHSTKKTTVTMTGCTIMRCFCEAIGSSNGGIIRTWAASFCTLKMEKCAIKNNKSKSNSCIAWNAVQTDPIQLIDDTISGNWTSGRGCGIWISGLGTIEGCVISGNYCKNYGGGLCYTVYTATNPITDFSPNNGTLTLDANTTISGNTAEGNGGGVYFQVNPLNIGNTTYYKNSEGEQYECSLVIDGATISGNKSLKDGGGIYLSRTTDIYKSNLEVKAGNIKDNQSGASGEKNGGGIYINSTLDGTTYGDFPSDFMRTDLNIIFGESAISAGDLTVTGNKANNGGGAYITGVKLNTEIYNGTFGTAEKPNLASTNGGGLYVSGGDVTIEGGNISYNVATNGSGGGLYSGGGDVKISKATISYNKAEKGNGGGLYSAAAITVGGETEGSGATISGNKAKNGGGFYVAGADDATTTIQSSSIVSNNRATVNGAGAFIESGNLTVKTSDINGNTADGNGGGFYVQGGLSTISGGTVQNNIATNGAGLYMEGTSSSSLATATFANGTFQNNEASGNGGGIYLASNSALTMSGTSHIMDNHVSNVSGHGGGVMVNGGQFIIIGGIGSSLKVDGNYVGESTNNSNNVYLNGANDYITIDKDHGTLTGITVGISINGNDIPKKVVYCEDATILNEISDMIKQALSSGTDNSIFDDAHRYEPLISAESPFEDNYLYFVRVWSVDVTEEELTNLANMGEIKYIDTPNKLAAFMMLANGYREGVDGRNMKGVITADLEMSGSLWIPIGGAKDASGNSIPFTGSMDGGGHVISDLISAGLMNYNDYGLFGKTDGAEIKNIVIENCNFVSGETRRMGALICDMKGGTVENCIASGKVIASGSETYPVNGVYDELYCVVGGLIGEVSSNAQIINCMSTVEVEALPKADMSMYPRSQKITVGGLVGMTSSGTVIRNSYAHSKISHKCETRTGIAGSGYNDPTPLGRYVGGLVGINNGEITNCYVRFQEGTQLALGEDTNNSSLFGMFAGSNTGSIINCYAPDKTEFSHSYPYLYGNAMSGLSDYGDYGKTVCPYTYSSYKKDNKVTYVNGSAVSGKFLLDELNSKVTTNNGYSHWMRTSASPINGDYPVLSFDNLDGTLDYTTVGSKDGIQLEYGHSVNTMIERFNGYADGGSLYIYKTPGEMQTSRDGVPAFTGETITEANDENVNIYLQQDVALKNDVDLQNVNACVVLDNSDASGFAGGSYDWHMFSTPLTDVPLGINYSNYTPAGSVYGTPSEVIFITNADGYFPTDTPYGKWDFYCYNEKHSTWINYKRATGDHYDTFTEEKISDFENEEKLILGKGYLAAADTDDEQGLFLQAKGTLNNADVNVAVTYSGHHVTGCNFIGNPYQAYLDFEEFFEDNKSNLASQSYAMIDADKKGYVYYTKECSKNEDQGSRYIHPHQGFIVKVNAAGTLNFKPDMAVVDQNSQTSPYRESHVDYPLVNLFASDSEGNREVATAELGRPENGGALKIEGMQMGKCTMSISNQGERYGIAFIEGNPEEVAVHFHATEDGDFTMKWNTYNGTFSYLHLIDNLTGMDIDCLSQSEYKFTASTGDYASRFKLKFEFTGVEENESASANSASFAFFHQGSLVVNGQGNLELIDLSGRVLMTKNLGEGQSTVALPEVPEGLYLLRLADDSNVKTQKIIIK